jgi:myosin heavy subunit
MRRECDEGITRARAGFEGDTRGLQEEVKKLRAEIQSMEAELIRLRQFESEALAKQMNFRELQETIAQLQQRIKSLNGELELEKLRKQELDKNRNDRMLEKMSEIEELHRRLSILQEEHIRITTEVQDSIYFRKEEVYIMITLLGSEIQRLHMVKSEVVQQLLELRREHNLLLDELESKKEHITALEIELLSRQSEIVTIQQTVRNHTQQTMAQRPTYEAENQALKEQIENLNMMLRAANDEREAMYKRLMAREHESGIMLELQQKVQTYETEVKELKTKVITLDPYSSQARSAGGELPHPATDPRVKHFLVATEVLRLQGVLNELEALRVKHLEWEAKLLEENKELKNHIAKTEKQLAGAIAENDRLQILLNPTDIVTS